MKINEGISNFAPALFFTTFSFLFLPHFRSVGAMVPNIEGTEIASAWLFTAVIFQIRIHGQLHLALRAIRSGRQARRRAAADVLGRTAARAHVHGVALRAVGRAHAGAIPPARACDTSKALIGYPMKFLPANFQTAALE